MKRYIYAFLILILFFVFLAVFVMLAESDAKDIRENVLRFHIVANSDSETDQRNKMSVRDGIAELCSGLFYSADSKADAIQSVTENADVIEQQALSILKNAGSNENVSVCVRKRFFPTRYYDGVSLPAGVYDTVDITIGKGEGKNFWCVMFPDICVGASTDKSNESKMSEILEGDSLAMATNPDTPTVKLKFKTVEIIENIFNFFRFG